VLHRPDFDSFIRLAPSRSLAQYGRTRGGRNLRLDVIRAGGKTLLRRWPVLYRPAKRGYIRTKLALDRRAFRRRHPGSGYVIYSQEQITQARAEGFQGQYGQDHYLWRVLFAGQTHGYFIDIGCNDPVLLSNSYYFEQQGWTGMAFDPLKSAGKAWRSRRSSIFHEVAISASRGSASFVEINSHDGWEHTLSGFAETVRPEDARLYGSQQYMVETAPLTDFLPVGQPVDLLLVDVEGAEETVLRGANLATVRPRFVLVENVSAVGGGEAVRGYLRSEGYELMARIGAADDLFAVSINNQHPCQIAAGGSTS
jgi:FkbM family methyltransferase